MTRAHVPRQVLYSSPASLATDAAALVLGPADEFKTAILSRVGDRLVGGAQGMVTELPPNYTLRFALVGRADGVTSAMYAYGALLRKTHGTAQTKLPLAADPLSRQLHYVTDGGSLLNYCDYWPQVRHCRFVVCPTAIHSTADAFHCGAAVRQLNEAAVPGRAGWLHADVFHAQDRFGLP